MSTDTSTRTACFILLDPSGEPWDTGDSIPHFPTRDQAESAFVAGAWDEDLESFTPKQLDTPCLFASCAECAYVLDEDDGMTYHFESAAEADAVARDWEWQINGGRRLCPACKDSTS